MVDVMLCCRVVADWLAGCSVSHRSGLLGCNNEQIVNRPSLRTYVEMNRLLLLLKRRGGGGAFSAAAAAVMPCLHFSYTKRPLPILS